MRRCSWALLVLAGCGRVDFDASADAGPPVTITLVGIGTATGTVTSSTGPTCAPSCTLTVPSGTSAIQVPVRPAVVASVSQKPSTPASPPKLPSWVAELTNTRLGSITKLAVIARSASTRSVHARRPLHAPPDQP